MTATQSVPATKTLGFVPNVPIRSGIVRLALQWGAKVVGIDNTDALFGVIAAACLAPAFSLHNSAANAVVLGAAVTACLLATWRCIVIAHKHHQMRPLAIGLIGVAVVAFGLLRWHVATMMRL
ncbi:MAG TPA: hypothetical protein VKU01_22220 [Bryobacteraceae bacterium]|nr:hypothetical protein [Bryobacteraceae bacterium]